MKKVTKFSIFILIISAFLSSCVKDDKGSLDKSACLKSPYKIGTSVSYTYLGNSTSNLKSTIDITKDSVINGKQYFKGVSADTNPMFNFIHVDGNYNIWQYNPLKNDIPSTEMITFKINAALGEKWSYSFAGNNTTIGAIYTYQYTLNNKDITVVLNDLKTSNCVKVNVEFTKTVGGIALETTNTEYVWCCELGITASSPNSTLTFPLRSIIYYKY